MTSNRSTLPYMRCLLDPITGPYPSDNAGRTCLLWLGGPRRPAGLRGQPRGRERGGPLASLPTRRCGAVCWASGGSESDFAAGETLNRSSGPPRGSRNPESTAGCQSKCLVKAQSVSISSLIAWFESCPLTSTDLKESVDSRTICALGLVPVPFCARVRPSGIDVQMASDESSGAAAVGPSKATGRRRRTVTYVPTSVTTGDLVNRYLASLPKTPVPQAPSLQSDHDLAVDVSARLSWPNRTRMRSYGFSISRW